MTKPIPPHLVLIDDWTQVESPDENSSITKKMIKKNYGEQAVIDIYSNDIDFEATDSTWRSALLFAFEKWNSDMIKLLSDAWSNLNRRYWWNEKSLLDLLIANWNKSMLQYLLSTRKDIDLDAADQNSKTILMNLVEAQMYEVAGKVLQDRFDIDLDVVDLQWRSLISYAIDKRASDLICLISDSGADINLQNSQNWRTPMMNLVACWLDQVFKHIVTSRTDIDLYVTEYNWFDLEKHVANCQNDKIKKIFEDTKNTFHRQTKKSRS